MGSGAGLGAADVGAVDVADGLYQDPEASGNPEEVEQAEYSDADRRRSMWSIAAGEPK